MPPATGVAIRFLIAGTLLLGIAVATRRVWPSDTAFRVLVVVQGVSLATNYYLIYWAEQTVSSGLTAVLFASFPIFTGAVAALVYRMERFSVFTLAALALGMAGLCVIFWSEVVLASRTPWQGMAAVVFSAFIASLGTTSLKRFGSHVPALLMAAPSQLLCGVLLTAVALLFERGRPVSFTPTAVASIAYLTIFGTAIAFVAYYQLLRLIPATRAALFNYVTPVVAVCLGAIFLHEALGARTLLGAAMVFASIWLMHVKVPGAPLEEAALS